MCDDHAERISVDWKFPSGLIRLREMAAKFMAKKAIEYVRQARKPFNKLGIAVARKHFKNKVGRELRAKRARTIRKWSYRALEGEGQ